MDDIIISKFYFNRRPRVNKQLLITEEEKIKRALQL